MRSCPLKHTSFRFLLKFLNPKQSHTPNASTNFTTLSSSPFPEPTPYSNKQHLAFLLQSCISSRTHHRNLHQIHSQIVVSGLSSDVFLNNVLLGGYSKSGCLANARSLFEEMTHRNLVSWSTVISMYSQHQRGEEALALFSDFRKRSTESPNEFILASALHACTQLRELGHASLLHSFAVKAGFASDVYVGTSLINFYSKIGSMESAMLVFDGLSLKNSFTWTAIIVGYSQAGKSEVSLDLFNRMIETGLQPDRFVISSVISACSILYFLDGGKQVHGYAYRNGIELDISVNNVLVDFYAKCSRVNMARILFDRMAVKNIVSWTTMIAGYMQNSCDCQAMELFSKMSRLGWLLDAFACTSVLTSCGSLMALQQGKQVHAYAVKANLEEDEYVKNGLVDMYAKCNSLGDARRAFDVMVEHNIVSYNAIIEGYASQEELAESIYLFNRMRYKSLCPSLLTYISLLGVSASQGAVGLSKQIHGLVIKSGVSLDLYSGSALVDVYSKCSCVDDARVVFEEMEDRDLVVWNAMFFCYSQNEEGEKALKLYHELCLARMKPNEFTFVALLSAASSLASLFHGLKFHSQIIKEGVDSDPHVANALIDTYAKCGSINEAREMFDMARGKDVVCWNSMISRYADHGDAKEALQLFRQMKDKETKPNYVTFLGVLSACSHRGLVEDGLFLFNSMKFDFHIEPSMEHYACVVGLLGRAGKLNEAKEFIDQMPIDPSAVVWRSFLGACRVYGDVRLGKYAAEMAMVMEPRDSGSYILLSNIFASKEMWSDVEKLRKGMDSGGVVKERGYSWIELRRKVHVFLSREKEHADLDLIYPLLDGLTQLIKDIGYETNVTLLPLVE